MEKNIYLIKLIRELKKEYRKTNRRIYLRIAELLSRTRKNRVEVNLKKIDKYSEDGEIIIVPGKVLGVGNINKKIKLYAYKYSFNAMEKLRKNEIQFGYIEDILEKGLEKGKIKIII